MSLISQGLAYTRAFLMVLASDHISGAGGVTVTGSVVTSESVTVTHRAAQTVTTRPRQSPTRRAGPAAAYSPSRPVECQLAMPENDGAPPVGASMEGPAGWLLTGPLA